MMALRGGGVSMQLNNDAKRGKELWCVVRSEFCQQIPRLYQICSEQVELWLNAL